MMSVLAFVVSPIGRYVVGAGVVTLLLLGVYTKGYSDGRAAYKAKIEREIQNAVRDGNAAREKALREFDALPDTGDVPNDGFRRD